MPSDVPGTLPSEVSIGIVSFLLDANGFSAGRAGLSGFDVLEQMRIQKD